MRPVRVAACVAPLLLSCFVPASAGPPDACVDAIVVNVTLVGRLQSGEFFGPPGYGEAPATDRLEQAWYLQLPAPPATQAEWPCTIDDDADAAASSHFVQLRLPAALAAQAQALAAARVQVSGRPYLREIGHDRTAILVDVATIRPLESFREPGAPQSGER